MSDSASTTSRRGTIDVDRAISVATREEIDRWFRAHDELEREAIFAIHNSASGRQTVGLRDLQEVALCHGWVDTQTKRIDAGRYAVRFVPRRRGSTWGPKNRAMARRLLDAGLVTPAGRAVLPDDL